MPYTVTELPTAEWDQLKNFGHFAITKKLPDPVHAAVLVLRDGQGTIVGSWFATDVVLLEGLHIEPDHRGNPVAAKTLLIGMVDFLKKYNVGTSITVAQNPAIGRLAKTAGFERIEGEIQLLTLKGED